MMLECKYCSGSGKCHDDADAFDDHEIPTKLDEWRRLAHAIVEESVRTPTKIEWPDLILYEGANAIREACNFIETLEARLKAAEAAICHFEDTYPGFNSVDLEVWRRLRDGANVDV